VVGRQIQGVTSSKSSASSPPGQAAIYREYAPAIRSYAARRVEADAVDDIVAETFAIAWRRLPARAEPLPWLYGVARRVVHGHRRSQSRRAALIARLISRHGGGQPSLDPAELITDDPALARAFATLSEIEREAVCLVAWEGLDAAGAATVAGCSVTTFAVRLSRARARLAAALEADPEPTGPSRPMTPILTVETRHEH
jgi:RNA polymerase sigma factor (sigma-70 family)